MAAPKFDVVIVGAGPAGITAAISLARTGVPVLVVESGVFPGAENWSGAVYFAEQLAKPDVLGVDMVRESAYERPVTKRGVYVCNGHSLAGLTYHDPSTFEHCYTVLRPTYDHYLAELARSFGAEILTETTVDGLMRDEENKVIGVHTDRGPIYADVVFLAEGDASHLVSKEGYERSREPGAPHFLQGIAEVIELDPSQIEHEFKLPRREGAAFEILLRNGSIHNRSVQLNMGGFIYTNAQSISLGLVMPLDNLGREFGGDHNRLMEWFKSLPDVRRWTQGGRSVAYGAKIIRGGGVREIPQLVDDGLVIGGAATGIGLDFPYPNFTGPATAMGRLFANAVREIRNTTGRNYTRLRLQELYEDRVRQSHYFTNVEFLKNWPNYVERTKIFFGRSVDMACGSLYLCSEPSLTTLQKVWQLAKFVREIFPPKVWREVASDLLQQRTALGLNKLRRYQAGPPSQVTGTCKLEFYVDGLPVDDFLWPISQFFRKLPGSIAGAADHLYRNDETPLPQKLRNAIKAARRGMGIGDFFVGVCFASFIAILAPIQWVCEMIKLIVTRPSPEQYLSSFYQKYRKKVRDTLRLDPEAVKIDQPIEEKLGMIRYSSETKTHIKVIRPTQFQHRSTITESALWHICPAKVYECRPDDLGQSQIIVNFENCIKCESCIRGASHDVDWTRQRKQRLTFQAYTPANKKLLELLKQNGANDAARKILSQENLLPSKDLNGSETDAVAHLIAELREFCGCVYDGPRYIDAGRVNWLLSILDRAERFISSIPDSRIRTLFKQIRKNAGHQRFFWAEADARQLLNLCGVIEGTQINTHASNNGESYESVATNNTQIDLRARIDRLFTKQVIKDVEHGKPLSPNQLDFLRDLQKKVSPDTQGRMATVQVNSKKFATIRALILSELARKDPSFAVLVSGIYSAQIKESPGLGESGWIGLTAARTYWKQFQEPSRPTLRQVASDINAIALGIGEMLLERCRSHSLTRIQFPTLFKDEDGREGIAKFGAVKLLLAEMEAQQYLMEAISQSSTEIDPAVIKVLSAEAIGPNLGSFTYNAGQIFGGTAFSEDDILSKYYRDGVCFSYLAFDNTHLKLELGKRIISAANDANEDTSRFADWIIECARGFEITYETAVLILSEAALAADALQVVKDRAAVSSSEFTAQIVKFFTDRLELAKQNLVTFTTDPDPIQNKLIKIGAEILKHGYFEAPLIKPPTFSYRDILHTKLPYDFGDFLVQGFDAATWRYVPEMLFADADLRVYYERLYKHFSSRFLGRTTEEGPYYQLVEKLHMIPLDDVKDMIQRGYTRMYIPKELGGEDLLKAHYYILCPLSMRYADPSYALTIMAHSSIGTTPILLGLNQDIPRAKADLQQFLVDKDLIKNIRSEIHYILRMLESPEAVKVKKIFTALGEKVRKDIGKKPMIRAVASEFLTHFMNAGRAGLRMDLGTFKSELVASEASLDILALRAEKVVAELERRTVAHRMFLKLISSGQISAFALTEPNAGSDSGGIQTRAILKKVEVHSDSDGVKYFQLGSERKNILDATKLEFDPQAFVISYHYSDTKPAAKIHFDDYDYKTDDPTKFRYYLHDVRKINIHDIAQIRREGNKEYYEYYEVNGAKMWITNGHVAGVMCLYARTPEGPTGFLVDRHSEGLIIGKDEEKMGQRGSPTNEITLTSVRVPRENVIGIEGRGQVNALETLNVGRTGLCVSATAMIAKIVEQTRNFVRAHQLEKTQWVQKLLGEMAAELYAVEALSFELIGRFDHHDTKSVRTESAIGKYYASEVLHRVIHAAEQIYGVEGLTQQHEIEKHRRDARVLNIYEGTNEVQRFLILRDLVDSILPKAKTRSQEKTKSPDKEIAQIESAKERLFADIERAVHTFGNQVWQNAGFQPTMFKLADIAGYIKTLDSALWRTRWLQSVIQVDGPEKDRLHLCLAGEIWLGFNKHAYQKISQLHAEFDKDLQYLKRGLYPPEVRAAFLALQEEEENKQTSNGIASQHQILSPMRVVVVMEIEPVLSPRPRVIKGDLHETHFEFSHASRTALAHALELKDASADTLITVVSVAPSYTINVLRSSLAYGADRAVLLETNDFVNDVHRVARLIADHIALKQTPCEIVLSSGQALSAVIAGSLGFVHCSSVEGFTVLKDQAVVTLEKMSASVERDLPAVLEIVPGAEPQDFTTDGFYVARSKSLTVIDSRQVEAEIEVPSRYLLPEVTTRQEHVEASPESAAAVARGIAGIATNGRDSGVKEFEGVVEIIDKLKVPTKQVAVFIATPQHIEGVEAAASCADAMLLPFSVVVIGHPDAKLIRQLGGKIHSPSVYFLTNQELGCPTTEGLVAALQTLWKDSLPYALIAGDWANECLAQFALTFPRARASYGVIGVEEDQGVVTLISPAVGGRVRRTSVVTNLSQRPLVMTLATNASVRTAQSGAGRNGEGSVKKIYQVPIEFDYLRKNDEMAQLFAGALKDTGAKSIADAEIIIDVGYAIRNKENFDLVVHPLKSRLEQIGVKNLMVGGTRKVVEELKLLAPDQQIGQTGQSVNPKLIIAIGVSGAPQHVNYIGNRATVICFNKDPEAPLMTLNERQASPKVIPIIGDLYDTVPRFTDALRS